MERRSGARARIARRIVIVEGDAAMRAVFAGVFEDDGFAVLTAGDRAGAELVLFGSSEPASVVVLDMGLGEEGDGAQLLASIAAMEQPPAMVLVSALRSRVEPLSIRYGVPFLLKPFDLGVFHAAVVTALENKLSPHDRLAGASSRS